MVYVQGKRVAGLADLAEGRAQMPVGYQDGYTLLQLRLPTAMLVRSSSSKNTLIESSATGWGRIAAQPVEGLAEGR